MEPLWEMIEAAKKEQQRVVYDSKEEYYWQGVKDGIRKAIMLLDPESKEDVEAIMRASLVGNEIRNDAMEKYMVASEKINDTVDS